MKSNYKKTAIIIGGSKGLGQSISKNLNKAKFKVYSCSRKDIDTSNLSSVERFIKKNTSADILVLNSGGPPPKKFNQITINEWKKYFNQLFLSYFYILKNINIKKMDMFFIFPHQL